MDNKTDGPYSIGAEQWNGLSKLIEECGEVIQVAGKIIGNGGRNQHWDGSNLHDRLLSEMGDLLAAIEFVALHYDRPQAGHIIANRASEKLKLFQKWHSEQKKSRP